MVAISLCAPLSGPLHATDDNGFEIVGHRAHVRIVPVPALIAVTDTISVRRTSGSASTLVLGLLPLYEVREVQIKDKAVPFRRVREGLQIDRIPADTLFHVVLSYATRRTFRSDFSSLQNERSLIREEDLLPYGQRALRFVRMTLAVPGEWTTVTAGTLVADDMSEGTRTSVWELHDHAPIIGWVIAGPYWHYRDDSGASPVSVYLFQEDSSIAIRMASLAQHTLEFYSARFSRYRFSKLALVEVEDRMGGPAILAVAAPSFVMVKSFSLTTDDSFNRVESILPHEIAHQWWPATVYVDEVDAPFLVEGMCEYSSLMFNEARGIRSIRDSLGHHPFLRPLLVRISKGRDIPLRKKADLRSYYTHYLKAAYVHHMLRRIVGDSAFFSLYHELPRRFSGQKISLRQFRGLAEELSGRPLQWFFDQWVEQTGIPRLKLYNVRTSESPGGWITGGRVRVLGYEKFTVRVEVDVETQVGSHSAVVWLGTDSAGTYRNDVGFEILTPSRPLRVLLDRRGDVLKFQKLPVRLSDIREPSDGVLVVGSLQDRNHLLRIAQRDSVELRARGWSVRIREDVDVTLADLQEEMVFLYGTAASNIVVADQMTKFPMRLVRDSLFVRGEMIFDSTLALTQAIENPFNAQGLMVWIAPLSDRAKPEVKPYSASWVVLRGKEEIAAGVWPLTDEDLVVDIP